MLSRQKARICNPSDTEKKGMFAPMEDALLCTNVVKCFSSQSNCRALEPEFLGSHPLSNLLYNPGDIAE